MHAAVHRHLLGHGSERDRREVSEAPLIKTTPTSSATNCGLWVGTDPVTEGLASSARVLLLRPEEE